MSAISITEASSSPHAVPPVIPTIMATSPTASTISIPSVPSLSTAGSATSLINGAGAATPERYHLYSVERKGDSIEGYIVTEDNSQDHVTFRTTSTAAIAIESTRSSLSSSSASASALSTHPSVQVFPRDEDEASSALMHSVLRRVANILEKTDQCTMTVALENNLFLVVIANTEIEGQAALVGIELHPTAGTHEVIIVVPIERQSQLLLDGDGGFHFTPFTETTRTYTFRPASVRSLWSAVQQLMKLMECAPEMERPGCWEWINTYRRLVKDPQEKLNQWSVVRPERKPELELIRQQIQEELDKAAASKEKTDEDFERELTHKLKEFMFASDLDTVTTKQLRTQLEEHFQVSLKPYRQLIDEQMIVIMGQMEAASKIFDYMYLGTEWNASNWDELTRNNVRYIINVSKEIPLFFPDKIKYHVIKIYDTPCAELMPHWENTFRFVREARRNGSNVLVHCKMGVSRSASTVIAYAMKQYSWTLDEALAYVKKRRPIVKPNEGFKQQLVVYEGILRAKRQSGSWGKKVRSERELDISPTRDTVRNSTISTDSPMDSPVSTPPGSPPPGRWDADAEQAQQTSAPPLSPNPSKKAVQSLVSQIENKGSRARSVSDSRNSGHFFSSSSSMSTSPVTSDGEMQQYSTPLHIQSAIERLTQHANNTSNNNSHSHHHHHHYHHHHHNHRRTLSDSPLARSDMDSSSSVPSTVPLNPIAGSPKSSAAVPPLFASAMAEEPTPAVVPSVESEASAQGPASVPESPRIIESEDRECTFPAALASDGNVSAVSPVPEAAADIAARFQSALSEQNLVTMGQSAQKRRSVSSSAINIPSSPSGSPSTFLPERTSTLLLNESLSSSPTIDLPNSSSLLSRSTFSTSASVSVSSPPVPSTFRQLEARLVAIEGMLRRLLDGAAVGPSAPAAGKGAEHSAVLRWTSDDVVAWAEAQADLVRFAPLLRTHGVTGADLGDLCNDDLRSIGVEALTDRKAILRAVRALLAAK